MTPPDDANTSQPAPKENEEDLGLTQASILKDLLESDDVSMLQLATSEGETATPVLQLGARKYRILGELGQGGMGRVYLAFDQDLGRNVALKMMRVQSTEGSRRFVEEARMIAQLDHPNIVPVYEVGLTERGRFFYTMRVVRGRTLAEVLDDVRNAGEGAHEYSLARLAQVFLQVGQGVAYAHAKEVVHRDIKPSNVMIGAHGEVLVLDWGLSRLAAAPRADSEEHSPRRRVAGTPRYMAPEQARGEEVDHRADIYSLGALLYEMLTLRPMFNEQTPDDLLEAVRTSEPAPPRQLAPDRTIPRALEEICLRAIAKDPSVRPPSVQALMNTVRTWLEAEADLDRRRRLAQEIAEEGRLLLDRFLALKEDLGRLESEAANVAQRFEGWQPAALKGPIIEAQDRVFAAHRELAEAASSVVATLEKALGFEKENVVAREALADYYWSCFQDAEGDGRENDAAFYARRVREYHDRKYERELEGEGTLVLESEPPGASAELHRFEPEGFVHAPHKDRVLGITPLHPMALPMGSYLVVLNKKGFREARYPVRIGRNGNWTGTVPLQRDGAIPEGFLHIPAGPFVCGGDADARHSLPLSEPVVADFLIAEHPVTMAEYLEFLNDVADREGLDAARAKSPRRSAADPVTTYLEPDGTGSLRLPDTDAEGDSWDPRLPVVGVSWKDAVAYSKWRSGRDRRRYRLPSETEWEKAARGVDGRWFPWGWRFDPSLCNMEISRRARPAPVPVDEFPTDRSVYGVRGCAGNVEEWTSTEIVEGEGERARVGRVVRGGGWNAAAAYVRCAARYDYAAETCSDILGFRLALDLDSS